MSILANQLVGISPVKLLETAGTERDPRVQSHTLLVSGTLFLGKGVRELCLPV